MAHIMPFDSTPLVNESTPVAAASLGQSLRQARRRTKLSQLALAEAAAIDVATVQNLEGGRGTLGPLQAVLVATGHRFADQPPDTALGSWLASVRKSAGYSQAAIALRIGVSNPTIIQIEHGRGHVANLLRVMCALGLTATVVPQADPIHGARLIHGDCLEVLGRLKAGSVDLAITSPPYFNIGMEYGDFFASLDDYVGFSQIYLKEINRVLTNTGACWVNVGMAKPSKNSRIPLTYHLFPILDACGFTLIQEIVWDRRTHLSTLSRFSTRSERWLWLVKNPKRYAFNLDGVRIPHRQTHDERNHPLGASPTDIWEYCSVQGRSLERQAHPCQFPLGMIERIVRACSEAGDTVLDPFAGAGTTAVAALRHERAAILIERDPKYCAVIERRLGIRRSVG
jgi:adenine-specific DNA-methyltransferase